MATSMGRVLLGVAPNVTAAPGSPLLAPGKWQSGLTATHFWDCNGFGCDATVMQPWDEFKYVAAPQYAPTDPAEYGGGSYGEKLWLTGAASDALSATLGADAGCCGSDKEGGGGCGQCLLVRNPTAARPDWTAVVMKKSRCPPWSSGCGEQHLHMDIAVPGFDNLNYSTANVCGSSKRADTYMTKAQSGTCGAWFSIANDTHAGCNCDYWPEDTPEMALLKSGCQLFSAWGWRRGKPSLEYQDVPCPQAFSKLIGDAFRSGGVRPPAPAHKVMWYLIAGASFVCLCLAASLGHRCYLRHQEDKAVYAADRKRKLRKRKEQEQLERRRAGSSSESASSSSSEGE